MVSGFMVHGSGQSLWLQASASSRAGCALGPALRARLPLGSIACPRSSAEDMEMCRCGWQLYLRF